MCVRVQSTHVSHQHLPRVLNGDCRGVRGELEELVAGADMPTFPWPSTPSLEPWELYLFALTYLRHAVIEHGAIPSADMYNPRNAKLAFPKVTNGDQAKMEPIVQLLRQPSLLFRHSLDARASADTSIPTYNVNTKLFFSSSALCHHLKAIERGGRFCKHHGVGAKKNSRVTDSRLGEGGWWQLVQHTSMRDHLVRLLREWTGISPTDSR